MWLSLLKKNLYISLYDNTKYILHELKRCKEEIQSPQIVTVWHIMLYLTSASLPEEKVKAENKIFVMHMKGKMFFTYKLLKNV